MSVDAAMAYLRFLREAQDITQAQVARVAGVESKQVYRWERGESEPTASGLAAFVDVVKGKADEVLRLIRDPRATRIDGQSAAERRLAEIKQETYAAVDALTDAEFAEAMTLYAQLAKDPKALMRWLGYGRRLSEERREEDDSR